MMAREKDRNTNLNIKPNQRISLRRGPRSGKAGKVTFLSVLLFIFLFYINENGDRE